MFALSNSNMHGTNLGQQGFGSFMHSLISIRKELLFVETNYYFLNE
jgi:hypothetical protein